MLKSLRLVNFRSFQDFTLTFGQAGAFLVGPNNAGKSTLLTALRTADVLLRFASSRSASIKATYNPRNVPAYPINLAQFPALRDSIRHEFGPAEASLELNWTSGARLVAVWPEDETETGDFFYVEKLPGMSLQSPANVKKHFPPLGVIPILGPVDHAESLLDVTYVSRNASGRLSSRHFRNQLRILEQTGKLSDFLQWAEPWLGDLSFDSLGQHSDGGDLILAAFFFEAGSRVPKELVWAGDGIQVWLQLLYHIHRTSHLDTLVLDEPEIYLHPDLQRRLVQLLEATGRQIVVATHSSEMIAEADSRLICLIDKKARRSKKATSEADLEMLSSMLGTAFNLRLARALRSKVALFLEGKDMVIIRRLAKTLNLPRLEREDGISIIQLHGYDRWGQVEPFAWLCSELLPEALRTFVILDRDYRSVETAATVEQKFAAAGLVAHVWRRKELESYLVNVGVIARLSGAPESLVAGYLTQIALDMESDVFSRLLQERLSTEVSASAHQVTVMTAYKAEFDWDWQDEEFRLYNCPPKQVLSGLNGRLQSDGYKAVSMSNLARGHRVGEIRQELRDALAAVEAAIPPM